MTRQLLLGKNRSHLGSTNILFLYYEHSIFAESGSSDKYSRNCMRTLFTAVLFLLASAVSAETILTSGIRTSASGTIFDKETGQTVPYANVVFVGSDIGTMSDENG